MLKQLFTLFFIFCAAALMAQTVQPNYADLFIFQSKTGKADMILHLPTDNVPNGVLTNAGNGKLEFRTSAAAATVPTGPVTSMPAIGFNPGTTDMGEWIRAAFFRAAPPLATLSGAATFELMGPGSNINVVLNWSAARQASTAPISSVIVGGIAQSSPETIAAGATRSGTQTVSVQRNVNTTFINTVTTTDGQTASASIAVAFSAKRYFGWVTSNNPTDAEIIAAGGELSASKTKSWTQPAPGSPQYLMFAYPATLGALSQFDINGFPTIKAVTFTTRNLTNAGGFTQAYIIGITNNTSSVAADVKTN